MRVLIADDNVVCRQLLTGVFRQWDLAVTEAANGEEAWQLLAQEPGPWLAVLDWQMPGLDGPEVCRRLRELPEDRLIYAITPDATVRAQDHLTLL